MQHGIGDTYELVIFIVHLILVVSSLLISCLVEPATSVRLGVDRPRFDSVSVECFASIAFSLVASVTSFTCKHLLRF